MPALAAISFVAPMMLGGISLALLPLIAHLLHRNARRPVVFPSIRLLRVSSASQSSLFRLRRRVLLAVRTMAVLLIVLAFAEPLWSGDAGADAAAGGSTVVVLDASASTQRSDGGTTVFERLRGEAARAVEGMHGGRDQAEVIVADDVPHGLAGALTPNLALLGDLLRDAAPGDARADLRGALALAGRLLAEAPEPRRVLVLTDGQRTNWADVADGSSAAGILPAGTHVECTAPPSAGANVGVETRGVSQRRAAPGQPIAARVRVHAFGAPAHVRLRVAVDGSPREARDVDVDPGRPREEAFTVSAADDGPHAVEIAVDHGDGLPIDDAAYATFDVGRRQPIAVLSDESPLDPERATYFLVRALAPYGDARDRFAPRVVPAADCTPAALADVRTLIVADVTRLGETQVAAIKGHLERGGSVVWFCGGGALAENLAALEAAMPGLLPFMPGLPGVREGRIVAGPGRPALLATFDEAAFVGLGQIRIGRERSCTAVRDDALHVLSFDDGMPALSLRRRGEGAFALANFSAAPRTGDLGRHGAFVALVQSLATELEMSDGSFRPSYVGEPLSIACGASASDGAGRSALRLLGPDGAALREAYVLEDRSDTSVTIDRPAHPGFHRVVTGEAATVAIGAVNIDPRESDPRVVEGEALLALVRSLVDSATSDGPGTAKAAPPGAAGTGTPIWWLAILAALAAIGTELALLAWWRR